jgi:hypothetical protein
MRGIMDGCHLTFPYTEMIEERRYMKGIENEQTY